MSVMPTSFKTFLRFFCEIKPDLSSSNVEKIFLMLSLVFGSPVLAEIISMNLLKSIGPSFSTATTAL